MASLVEMQDLTQETASSFLQDSVHAIITDFDPVHMQLPTPPLSPEHIDPNSPSSLKLSVEPEAGIEDQHAEALLDHMLECEQIPTFDEAESYTDSQGSYASSLDSTDILIPTDLGAKLLLIQDCMWGGHTYEPRSLGNINGVYTPAPSPPPMATDKMNNEDPKEIVVEEQFDTLNKDTMEDSPDVQSECISPCDIFPTYMLVTVKEGSKVTPKPRLATTTNAVSEASRHPQAMCSESDEEIDVVTVTERAPTRMTTRKRQFSVSAPCSRQTSPTPSSPKKRKYTTLKRLQRINSTCSSVGDGTESDDEQRRASHNILERKRRNDLKSSFQVLREHVPDLEDNQRAPKVTILKKAAEYIKRIQVEGRQLDQELEREKKREVRLRQRLAFLKAMPAVC